MKKIGKFFNNNILNTKFKGTMKEEKPLNDKEKRIYMLKECSKKLSSQAEMEVPENGDFKPTGISYLINGTNNVAILEVSKNTENPKTQRDLNIGVRHKNSDKVYNNFAVYTGTKREIIDFLKDIDITLENNIMDLSELVDKSCSSL